MQAGEAASDGGKLLLVSVNSVPCLPHPISKFDNKPFKFTPEPVFCSFWVVRHLMQETLF